MFSDPPTKPKNVSINSTEMSAEIAVFVTQHIPFADIILGWSLCNSKLSNDNNIEKALSPTGCAINDKIEVLRITKLKSHKQQTGLLFNFQPQFYFQGSTVSRCSKKVT